MQIKLRLFSNGDTKNMATRRATLQEFKIYEKT